MTGKVDISKNGCTKTLYDISGWTVFDNSVYIDMYASKDCSGESLISIIGRKTIVDFEMLLSNYTNDPDPGNLS